MDKYTCCKCQSLAIWRYEPQESSTIDSDRYFCDECISRGCSCNFDPNTGIEDCDHKGRPYPCCEYFFDDRGFEK